MDGTGKHPSVDTGLCLVGVGLGLWKKDRKMTCWAGTAFGLAVAFIILFFFALANSDM